MKNDVSVFGAVSPSATGARSVADIVAALAPPAKGSTAMVQASSGKSLTASVKHAVPGAVGAVAGYYVGKKRGHSILGALAGHAVGSNAKALYNGDRKRALCNLAVEGAAILGALKYKKVPMLKHPVVGYAVGALVGGIATYFVSGSPAREAYDNWRNR
jgi:hypothetical protein